MDKVGAGYGNRTRLAGLGSQSITTMLSPRRLHFTAAKAGLKTRLYACGTTAGLKTRLYVVTSMYVEADLQVGLCVKNRAAALTRMPF